MSILVRRDFHAQIFQNSFLDSDANRSLAPRTARRSDKHRVGTLADHGGGNLVAIGVKTIAEHRGKREIEDNLVFGFIAPESDKCGITWSLRPVQMLVKIQSR